MSCIKTITISLISTALLYASNLFALTHPLFCIQNEGSYDYKVCRPSKGCEYMPNPGGYGYYTDAPAGLDILALDYQAKPGWTKIANYGAENPYTAIYLSGMWAGRATIKTYYTQVAYNDCLASSTPNYIDNNPSAILRQPLFSSWVLRVVLKRHC